MFGIITIFKMFLKEAYSAHKGLIYLIKDTVNKDDQIRIFSIITPVSQSHDLQKS